MRKIIHVDMDAFYASIEQRDDPSLRGKPVVIAWRGARSVVCAASYEARKFGVRSAMPAITAERLCPQAEFRPPDFIRYRAASKYAREIFARHTELIEPLSLDEAYLDVTENRLGLPTATRVAQVIRAQIREEMRLTASAGVAPNKFLAKLASDVRKPDGLFVVLPGAVDEFLLPLPVSRIPGVGKVMDAKLEKLGVCTIAQLRERTAEDLESRFGKYGRRLHALARGIDERPVEPHLETQSVSAEDTFERDVTLAQTEGKIRELAVKVWAQLRKERRKPRTVVLKLKTKDFQVLTRSLTPKVMPGTAEALAEAALALRERVGRDPRSLYRLVGVGLGNFEEPMEAEPELF